MYIRTLESCPSTQDFVQINWMPRSSASIFRPGDNAILLCTTFCSHIQAWDSADYIDVGGHYLEVLCLPNMNQVTTKGLANATCIDCYLINETCPVIAAQLKFIVQADIPMAHISCININRNCSATVEFNVSRKLSMERIVYPCTSP